MALRGVEAGIEKNVEPDRPNGFLLRKNLSNNTCHSERSEESSRICDAGQRSGNPIGFFAALGMTIGGTLLLVIL
jgi:hypothetical protein